MHCTVLKLSPQSVIVKLCLKVLYSYRELYHLFALLSVVVNHIYMLLSKLYEVKQYNGKTPGSLDNTHNFYGLVTVLIVTLTNSLTCQRVKSIPIICIFKYLCR